MCVKDCESGGPLDANDDCAGIVEDAWIWLYDTVRECCEVGMGWQDPDLCTCLSDPACTGTNKFYVIQKDEKCAQDCPSTGDAPCAGSPDDVSARLYDTATECCKEKLPWMTLDRCLAATNGSSGSVTGTGYWYVNWTLEQCVRDCLVGAGPNCGGLKESWDFPHANVADCCASISWIPSNECT